MAHFHKLTSIFKRAFTFARTSSQMSFSKHHSNVRGQTDEDDISEERPLNFKVIVS